MPRLPRLSASVSLRALIPAALFAAFALGTSDRAEASAPAGSDKAVAGQSKAEMKSGSAAREAPKAKPAAWLGVSIADVPAAEIPAAFAPITKEGAVRIQQVFKGTSADQAGLKEGDFILAINGMPLMGRKTLLDTIHSKTIGDIVELRIGRDGKAALQKMALSPRPEDMRSITQMLVGGPAPSLDGKYYSGDVGSLAKNKGKVVLLDFWATWCGPCRMTIPALDAVYKKYHDKGLEVIGVSSESLDELKAFQASGKVGYPLFNDVAKLTTNHYQAFAYPTLVVIDRQGVIQRIEVGAHPQAAIEKWVQEYL
ncbi:MAG: PDZ/thioredoxin domain protein [Fibrobacteres bacterium]|nr:PDZ/thioredoxin domain protein [Fibrobacterota bacterium]